MHEMRRGTLGLMFGAVLALAVSASVAASDSEKGYTGQTAHTTSDPGAAPAPTTSPMHEDVVLGYSLGLDKLAANFGGPVIAVMDHNGILHFVPVAAGVPAAMVDLKAAAADGKHAHPADSPRRWRI